MRDRLRLRGIISDESQNLFLAFAERGNFSQHRLALVPPHLAYAVDFFNAERLRSRR